MVSDGRVSDVLEAAPAHRVALLEFRQLAVLILVVAEGEHRSRALPADQLGRALHVTHVR